MRINLPTFKTLQDNCPANKSFVIERLTKVLSQSEMTIIDWVGLGLSDKTPDEFTQDDWQLLGDELDEIITP